MKRLGGTETNFELIHLGHASHRPHFPRGLIVELPVFGDDAAARRGGLSTGAMYRTAEGVVRVVV